jgi:hypothetical protein
LLNLHAVKITLLQLWIGEMSYFVFLIDAEKALTYVDEFDDFKSAKDLCRSKREEGVIPKNGNIRLIFAKNKKEAKSLLKEKRKPSTPVEEWEV